MLFSLLRTLMSGACEHESTSTSHFTVLILFSGSVCFFAKMESHKSMSPVKRSLCFFHKFVVYPSSFAVERISGCQQGERL